MEEIKLISEVLLKDSLKLLEGAIDNFKAIEDKKLSNLLVALCSGLIMYVEEILEKING